jgi:hypothetical protein
MVGLDAGNAAFDTAEETGGSADAIVVSHTHTATSTVTDPGHSHTSPFNKTILAGTGGSDIGGESRSASAWSVNSNTTGVTVATTNASTGSSGTNANLPPYITVRMWKRTA